MNSQHALTLMIDNLYDKIVIRGHKTNSVRARFKATQALMDWEGSKPKEEMYQYTNPSRYKKFEEIQKALENE